MAVVNRKEILNRIYTTYDLADPTGRNSAKQREIFDNCDSDYLKKLATPKTNGKQLSTAKIARIKSMKNSGYTMQEIADDLGVSTSTVSRALKGEL